MTPGFIQVFILQANACFGFSFHHILKSLDVNATNFAKLLVTKRKPSSVLPDLFLINCISGIRPDIKAHYPVHYYLRPWRKHPPLHSETMNLANAVDTN